MIRVKIIIYSMYRLTNEGDLCGTKISVEPIFEDNSFKSNPQVIEGKIGRPLDANKSPYIQFIEFKSPEKPFVLTKIQVNVEPHFGVEAMYRTEVIKEPEDG